MIRVGLYPNRRRDQAQGHRVLTRAYWPERNAVCALTIWPDITTTKLRTFLSHFPARKGVPKSRNRRDLRHSRGNKTPIELFAAGCLEIESITWVKHIIYLLIAKLPPPSSGGQQGFFSLGIPRHSSSHRLSFKELIKQVGEESQFPRNFNPLCSPSGW
jgi:hypothetical protein